MRKINFGFVILHYQTLDLTVDCVENLFKNFDMKNNFVVIVDNNSPNGSGQELFEKYVNIHKENIKVILTKENLGFAKGNNLGYNFLKENFNIDFIVVMNNDVFILQKDFFDIIEQIYSKKPFCVLGPDIYNPNTNEHQSPMREDMITYKELLSEKKYYSRQANHYDIFSLYIRIKGKIQRMTRYIFKLPDVKKRKVDRSKTMENCCLQGACYIFSKDFIKLRQHAFNPNTFMYFEEQILQYECIKNNMLIIYSPDISVNHLSGISTKNVFSNKSVKQKQIFFAINVYNSINVLLDEYSELQPEGVKIK